MRHHSSSLVMTSGGRKAAGVTGVTDQLSIPLVTGDGLSLVRPHVRAGGGERQNGVDASPDTVQLRGRPSWLGDGPLTDRVRLKPCPRCKHAVLEALVDGLVLSRVDPLRLTPAAELAHRLAGGKVRRLWPDPCLAGELRLAYRGLIDIRAKPGRGLPEHQCGVRHGHPDPDVLRPGLASRPTPTDVPF